MRRDQAHLDQPTLTEIQAKISQYLRRSAGTANWPTDHTFRCFVGMIETGEATIDDFDIVGGRWLVEHIQKHKEQISARATN